MSSSPLLVVRQLAKAYRGGPSPVRVLCDLDLDLYQGEALAIVGASGVGKSTLLHLLGGLDRPDAGEMQFRGSDLLLASTRERARYRNEEVGFVFQFHHLLPEFSALENVEMPLRIGRQPIGGEARELLRRLGLEGRLAHRPGELSGGEQQRVAIARALVRRPALVLADEPTGNLDPATGDEVFSVLRQLQQERPFALALATHNAHLASRCDRRLQLENGSLRALDDRETREYFDRLGTRDVSDPML